MDLEMSRAVTIHPSQAVSPRSMLKNDSLPLIRFQTNLNPSTPQRIFKIRFRENGSPLQSFSRLNTQSHFIIGFLADNSLKQVGIHH